MNLKLITLLLLFCLAGYTQNVDTLTNKNIIELNKAGFGGEVIKAKIQSCFCKFELSTGDLTELKQSGISDDIITLMIQKKGAENQNKPTDEKEDMEQIEPGIYYLQNADKLIELDASVYTQSKMGSGVMSGLTYGLAKTKMKATLNNKQSNFIIEEQNPVFNFYFNKESSNDFGNVGSNLYWFSSAKTPNEFLLIKFTLSTNKKSREVVTGSFGTYSGMASGIDDKYKVQFKYEKISKGVFRVYFEKPLEKGEYCFMYAGSSPLGLYGMTLDKVYDFSIR